MSNTVTFPGLGLEFTMDRVAFTVLGHPIYWYGIIIAGGFLLAVWFCYRRAERFGVVPDSLIDMLLFAVPAAVIGARLYYIVYDLGRSDAFRNPDGSLNLGQMVRIWDGGLAIYGGVIAAVVTVWIFCRVRKVKVGAYLDVGAFGLLIGQAVGRWGNFVNVEVFGYETTLPWRMGVNVWDPATLQYVYQEVHPTFLYESLWNLVGLGMLTLIAKRGWRKFDGQLFLTYVLWYGVGRAWIEGMRQDYLPFFGLELFGAPVRVSQVLAVLFALTALGLLVYHLAVRKHSPEELFVNQQAEKKAVPGEGDDLDKAQENSVKL